MATVTVSAADPTTPTGLTATYGQTLADVSLPTGWAWKDSMTSVGDAGIYYVWYKAKGDENHKDSEAKAVSVTIALAPQPEPKPQTKKKTDINDGLKLSEKNGVVTFNYGEVTDADSYVVYFRYCGTSTKKPLMTVKGAKNTTVKIKKYGGKKINRKRSYTLWVVAKKGKKVLKTSAELHVAGSRNKGVTTAFYNAARDIARLADVLGHSSINTTRIYISTSGQFHSRIIEGLGLVQSSDGQIGTGLG